ncbi:hypothetical protein [Haloarcula regularis]|uniref:hypothetical protein n=1 Tax=Haloarcula regularis TaxID=3033392 RepID=UPI0023E8C5E4|nr:hypothetical protein [Halomicroarcula sp. SYNS111]
MPAVPPHCRLDVSLPDAAGDYFAPEHASLTAYLDLVPASLDPDAGDAAFGPVFPLPWFYVADLTGWHGSALARLLAAEVGGPCYQLSTSARDSVPTLWTILEASASGPVVVYVELRGGDRSGPADAQRGRRPGLRTARDRRPERHLWRPRPRCRRLH